MHTPNIWILATYAQKVKTKYMPISITMDMGKKNYKETSWNLSSYSLKLSSQILKFKTLVLDLQEGSMYSFNMECFVS